jgi:Predicted transcriptional regulator
MKISSRFSIAVHIVLTIALLEKRQKLTSQFLASCVNVNPVVIRKLLGNLKKAGFVDVKPGEGGAVLLKSPADLTLFDIYSAAEGVENVALFNFHKSHALKCPVDCSCCPLPPSSASCCTEAVEDDSCYTGPNTCCLIHSAIDDHLLVAQKAMEESLKKMTVQQLIDTLIE